MEKRNTKQKILVKQIVMDLNMHVNAETIYQHVHQIYPKISLATVYRILNEMVEQQELIAISSSNGPTIFDPTTHPHYHGICNVCNQLFDVEVPYQKQLDAMGKKALGQSVTHELIFKGVCSYCRSTSN